MPIQLPPLDLESLGARVLADIWDGPLVICWGHAEPVADQWVDALAEAVAYLTFKAGASVVVVAGSSRVRQGLISTMVRLATVVVPSAGDVPELSAGSLELLRPDAGDPLEHSLSESVDLFVWAEAGPVPVDTLRPYMKAARQTFVVGWSEDKLSASRLERPASFEATFT